MARGLEVRREAREGARSRCAASAAARRRAAAAEVALVLVGQGRRRVRGREPEGSSSAPVGGGRRAGAGACSTGGSEPSRRLPRPARRVRGESSLDVRTPSAGGIRTPRGRRARRGMRPSTASSSVELALSMLRARGGGAGARNGRPAERPSEGPFVAASSAARSSTPTPSPAEGRHRHLVGLRSSSSSAGACGPPPRDGRRGRAEHDAQREAAAARLAALQRASREMIVQSH